MHAKFLTIVACCTICFAVESSSVVQAENDVEITNEEIQTKEDSLSAQDTIDSPDKRLTDDQNNLADELIDQYGDPFQKSFKKQISDLSELPAARLLDWPRPPGRPPVPPQRPPLPPVRPPVPPKWRPPYPPMPTPRPPVWGPPPFRPPYPTGRPIRLVRGHQRPPIIFPCAPGKLPRPPIRPTRPPSKPRPTSKPRPPLWPRPLPPLVPRAQGPPLKCP